MRIVGGKFKGWRLSAPPSHSTRPTTDRAREAIFNILSHGLHLKFDGIAALDLFSGTGALGFEALSRGAESVLFVENETSAINCIKSNGIRIGETKIFSIRCEDASCLSARTRREKSASLAFLDPPFGKKLISPTLFALDSGDWLQVGAVIVVEMARDEYFELIPPFSLKSERHYGNAKFAFLSYGVDDS